MGEAAREVLPRGRILLLALAVLTVVSIGWTFAEPSRAQQAPLGGRHHIVVTPV